MNYILDFKNETTSEQISSYLNENGLTVVKTYNHFDKIFIVSGNSLPPKTDILEHVVEDHDHGISLLENTSTLEITTENDNINLSDEKNWWKIAVLDKVNFDQETQVVKKGGSRITVYLLDSGVNINHSEFDTGRVQNLFSFTGDFTDTKGHGTALASVITGKTCGISNATVKSVKIFDLNVATKQSDLLSAFDAVALDYTQNGLQISVVNLSWSIPKNEYIEAKINYLNSLGLVVFCAAGNSGAAIADVTPASMASVIKVGSFNQNFEPCNFSDYEGGSHLSLTTSSVNYSDTTVKNLFGWAPGELIYTATKDGNFGYTAGTSISCAIVSAVFAHNSDLKYTNDGSIDLLPHTAYITKFGFFNFLNHLFQNIFSRSGVLNLSETYSSCPNRILTLKTTTYFGLYDENLDEIRYVGLYDIPFKVRLFDAAVFNTVVYGELPEDFKIDNGFIYGKTSNTENQVVKQFSIPLKISGTNQPEKNITATLTFGNNINEMKDNNVIISSVDPTIDITLLNDAYCTFNTGTSFCEETATGCAMACNLGCSDIPGGPYESFTYSCQGNKAANCCCTCCCGPIIPSGCSAIITPLC